MKTAGHGRYLENTGCPADHATIDGGLLRLSRSPFEGIRCVVDNIQTRATESLTLGQWDADFFKGLLDIPSDKILMAGIAQNAVIALRAASKKTTNPAAWIASTWYHPSMAVQHEARDLFLHPASTGEKFDCNELRSVADAISARPFVKRRFMPGAGMDIDILKETKKRMKEKC
jgi:hypothetical protein